MTVTDPTSAGALPVVPRPAQFAGFDCGNYPGDAVMNAWSKGQSPYSFACYYLEAPCHSRRGFTSPWSGHRELLDSLGWGFIITYVGRQASGCGSSKLSRETGLADGGDAIAKTRAEGFPPGAVIFLDVEAVQTAAEIAPYTEYFKGWTAAVIASEFRSGVYCNPGDRLFLAVASSEECALKNPVGDDVALFWICKLSPKFSLRSMPDGCGVSYAKIWQGVFDVAHEEHNGASIPLIDLNVATTADPSSGRTPPAVS